MLNISEGINQTWFCFNNYSFSPPFFLRAFLGSALKFIRWNPRYFVMIDLKMHHTVPSQTQMFLKLLNKVPYWRFLFFVLIKQTKHWTLNYHLASLHCRRRSLSWRAKNCGNERGKGLKTGRGRGTGVKPPSPPPPQLFARHERERLQCRLPISHFKIEKRTGTKCVKLI